MGKGKVVGKGVKVSGRSGSGEVANGSFNRSLSFNFN